MFLYVYRSAFFQIHTHHSENQFQSKLFIQFCMPYAIHFNCLFFVPLLKFFFSPIVAIFIHLRIISVQIIIFFKRFDFLFISLFNAF